MCIEHATLDVVHARMILRFLLLIHLVQAAALNSRSGSGSDSRYPRKEKLYQLLKDDDGTFYQDDILGSTVFYENTYSRQPYVANGYIGARLPNVGFGYSPDTVSIWSDSDIPGSLDNGWPLRNHRYSGAFVSDFYCLEKKLNSTNFPELDKKGYTSVLSSIPQWTNLQLSIENGSRWFNATAVVPEDVSNYSQNLSLKDGIVTTELDWLDGLLTIKSEIMCHKNIMPLATVSLNVTLNTGRLDGRGIEDQLAINIYDILDFSTSHRTVLRDSGFDSKNEGIHMIVEPRNVPYSNSAIYSTCSIENGNEQFYPDVESSTDERISQVCNVTLSRESPWVMVRKYVGIVSTEYHSTYNDVISNLEFAKQIAIRGKDNYEYLLSIHRKAWEQVYDGADIQIPSDKYLEMAARASMYHLFANTRSEDISEERGLPVPVSGLSSDSYGGMVFWDSEIWIQPALLPFSPQTALGIGNYRNSTRQQAMLNARENGYPGAVYPWTSGRYANCSSTGPCIDYEYHVNIDIALASFSVYLNGAEGVDDTYLRYTTWPIIKNAADFFMEFVEYNATLDRYETHNLTDPDEFANHIDNGAFTNAGIKAVLKWAAEIGYHLEEKVNSKWMHVSQKMYIPRAASNITLEYSGMNSSVESKQADVLLINYPLNIGNENSPEHDIKDLYYYSERQSVSGPAMTFPVYVAASASLLKYGSSSQSYLYKSVQPFLRGPFAQFSEQADDDFLTNGLTQPAFPFLTGSGGFLQSLLFGLTGIRYSYDINPSTKKISRILKFDPTSLLLLQDGIAIKNFKYMNQVLDIIVDNENGIIAHKVGDMPIRVEIPRRIIMENKELRFHSFNIAENLNVDNNIYTLNPGEKLLLPLLKSGLNIDGNIVESREVTNLTAGVPGDIAYSALDGNNFTHWQPLRKNETSMLFIDLGEDNMQEIKSGLILWGRRPAKNITLSILPNIFDFERLLGNLTTNQRQSTKTELLKECIKSPDGNCSLNLRFIQILQDLKIEPSEPYSNSTEIDLLPSNKTEFKIGKRSSQSEISQESLLTRFIVLSLEGAYGDMDDNKGATLKELVLRA